MVYLCLRSVVITIAITCEFVTAFLPQVVEVGAPANVTCDHEKSRDDHVVLWKRGEEIWMNETMTFQFPDLQALPNDIQCASVPIATALEHQHNLTGVWERADTYMVPLIGIDVRQSTESHFTNVTARLAVSGVNASEIALDWSSDNTSVRAWARSCAERGTWIVSCETISWNIRDSADLMLSVIISPAYNFTKALWTKVISVSSENTTEPSTRDYESNTPEPELVKIGILSALIVLIAGFALVIVVWQCKRFLWDMDPNRDDTAFDGLHVSVEHGKISFSARAPQTSYGVHP